MQGFAVTYEIVTEESSREGDAAKRGFLGQDISGHSAMRIARLVRCYGSN